MASIGRLIQRTIRVDDANGQTVAATLFICPCGNETWLTYAIPGLGVPHQHLQCTNCGASYCDGTCGG